MTEYRNVIFTPAPSDESGQLDGELRYTPASSWMKFSGRVDLTWIREVTDDGGAAGDRIWGMQDGYGIPGFNAGDWSGIRDSSEPTTARMWAVARDALPAAEFFARLGIPVPRPYVQQQQEAS